MKNKNLKKQLQFIINYRINSLYKTKTNSIE